MPAPILIIGQGLAGSLLAWEFECAGIDFEIADQGHAEASSRIGAGIINPITGQRLVKSWRIDELLPAALTTYGDMEKTLGVSLLRAMRVRRFFHDGRERRIFAEKCARRELTPYAGEADESGFWIEGAAQVDTAALITAMRRRLLTTGRLREEAVEWTSARRRHDLVILCTGASKDGLDAFDFVGLQLAKGEILTVEVSSASSSDSLVDRRRVEPNVILNDGHWLLPLAHGRARIGATFEPGLSDLHVTAAARAELEKSARRLLGDGVTIVEHEAGLRVTTRDKHPVVGRNPRDPHVGIFNGLGSKGALLAPGLARQWMNHLTEGVPFDSAVDVVRFVKRAD